MRKETKVMGIVLALVLVLSITSTGVAQPSANPVRDMPESVEAGADFSVTVTWTAPADDFNSIGVHDEANARANMAVSGDKGWCTPNANSVKPENNIIEYVWYGPYNSGTSFTAVYNVHVPTAVSEGNYTFDGNLEYYIAGAGPYTEDITGNSVITVVKALTTTPTPTAGGDNGGDGDGEVPQAETPTPAETPEPTPTITPIPTPMEEEKTYENITAGEEVKVELIDKELTITFKKNVSRVKITAKEFVQKPADIPDAPRIVFKYLEYHIENVSAEDVGKITIPFDVPKSWITSENIDPVTVRLNRYYEDVWKPLPTEKVGEDDEYIYYSADTEGLLIFAITGEKRTEAEVPASAMWVWAIVGVVLLIVVIGGVWYYKKKRK